MSRDTHDQAIAVGAPVPYSAPLPQFYAGFWRRLGAMLVDIVVLIPLGILRFKLYTVSKEAACFAIALLPLVFQVYTVYFHYRWGATIGKMAVGIRVTTLDGYPIGIIHALKRSSVDIAFVVLSMGATLTAIGTLAPEVFTSGTWQEISRQITQNMPFEYEHVRNAGTFWFSSEVIVILFNKKKRALHDFLAGTIVVCKRLPRPSMKDEDAITVALTRDMKRLEKRLKR